jgi:transposase InsO family protein
MWQMDFKGWFRTGDGRVDPFDILDDHSRFNLCLQVADQSEPTVRALLEVTFGTYGLPNRILCDNGSPWANTQPGHRWTRLGIWLVDLGIEVVHSRVRHPQTLGKDERFHRTLDLEVISTRPTWDSHQQLQAAFDQWRTIYNHQRPHDALGGAVPADRYQPSTRPLPTTITPIEYPDAYEIRQVSTKGQISYHGRTYRVGTAFARKPVGITPTPNDTIAVYYRHQHIRTITPT